jgi:hypothetical protein
MIVATVGISRLRPMLCLMGLVALFLLLIFCWKEITNRSFENDIFPIQSVIHKVSSDLVIEGNEEISMVNNMLIELLAQRREKITQNQPRSKDEIKLILEVVNPDGEMINFNITIQKDLQKIYVYYTSANNSALFCVAANERIISLMEQVIFMLNQN